MVSVAKLGIIQILVLISIATMANSFTTALLLGQHFKASSRIRNIPGTREGERVCTDRLFLTAPQYEPSLIKCAMNGVGKDESGHQPKILQFNSPYGQPSDKVDEVEAELKELKSELMRVEESFDSVNDQISKLEADILDGEKNCAELVNILKNTKDTLVEKELHALYIKVDKLRDEKNLLRDKENKLRDKENKLRDKENRLREEKNLLITRTFKLSDEMQGPAGELLCGRAYLYLKLPCYLMTHWNT
jgi:septal ring factor EnvC (AmiA/AmiB activator)